MKDVAADLFVALPGSRVGLRMRVVALEPAEPDHFDEKPCTVRRPDYSELVEAGELIAAGRAERWAGQLRMEGEKHD